MNLMHMHTYDGLLNISFSTYFKQSGTIHFEEEFEAKLGFLQRKLIWLCEVF